MKKEETLNGISCFSFTSFMLWLLLAYFTTEQNIVKTSLFLKSNY